MELKGLEGIFLMLFPIVFFIGVFFGFFSVSYYGWFVLTVMCLVYIILKKVFEKKETP